MNVFATNACPVKSAQQLDNILVRKMIVESCQLLSVAHYAIDGTLVAMKPTHQNHPSAKWTRQSKGNYLWLFEHFKALCSEYTHRTGKVHKSSEHIKNLSNLPVSIDAGAMTEIPFVGPDEFRMKSLSCVHGAYRIYLKSKWQDWQTRQNKRQMDVSWGVRDQPEWV